LRPGMARSTRTWSRPSWSIAVQPR
jgi:hypothetical protein